MQPQLQKRASDARSKWFEYGRSQALEHINCEKIVISTVITGSVHAYILDRDVVPYSGLYITVKERPDSLSLQKAKELLESQDFFKYIEPLGVNASGNSIRIVAKSICDYRW